MAEENLDDVIADLIDDDEGAPAEPSAGAAGSTSADPKTVSLTSRAADQIRKIREDENLGEELYLRVAVEGGGCSGLSYRLGFDPRTDDDICLESEGVEIVVDPRHAMYLEGMVVDYPDGLDARGFTFDNPNASETCGCGSSFAT